MALLHKYPALERLDLTGIPITMAQLRLLMNKEETSSPPLTEGEGGPVIALTGVQILPTFRTARDHDFGEPTTLGTGQRAADRVLAAILRSGASVDMAVDDWRTLSSASPGVQDMLAYLIVHSSKQTLGIRVDEVQYKKPLYAFRSGDTTV